MHTYNSDAPDRRRVPVALAGIAVGCAYGLYSILQATSTQPPWWVDTPSVVGFYGLLYTAFDHLGWRIRLLGIRFSKNRDLRGTWTGLLTTSHNGGSEIPITIWVTQTWTHLRVRVATQQSASHSVTGAVFTEEAAEPGLMYQYVNDPKPLSAPSTMHAHRGTASFRFSQDVNLLEGDYYTGRDRSSYGSIVVRRVSSMLLDRNSAIETMRQAGVPKAS